MTAHSLSLVAVCGLLATLPPAAVAERSANTTIAGTGASTTTFSGNLGEVVRLFQAGVDEAVILAFVQNSPIANQPSADEIIKLRNLGISSEVIAAVLRRGGELRAQWQTAAAAPSRATVSQSASTYSTPGSAPAQTVVYLNSSPAYSEAPYSYAYAYSWSYPSYYYPYFYFPYFYTYYPGFNFGGRFHGQFHPRFHQMTPATGGHFGGVARVNAASAGSFGGRVGTIQIGRRR